MLTPHELWLRRPRCWSTPDWQAIESGKRVIRSRFQATPKISYLQILCWSRGSIKPAQKKTNDKTTEKTTKEEEKSTLPAATCFLLFFWPIGLGETLANFFQRIFGVCSRFSRNKRLWTELCNFLGWFPFYHFDILLAVLINLDVIFCLGLEIKPCESRLECVHPKKIKKQTKQMIKQQRKTTKDEEKNTLPAKTCFFFLAGAYGSRGNSRKFFSSHFWSLLQIFKKQTFMNRTLQLFGAISILSLWCFARCADEFRCIFFGGVLKLTPASRDLNLSTPKNTKTNKQMIKQQKKLPKRTKKVFCLQNQCFHIFFGPMGLEETLANFFSFIFPVSWILREKIYFFWWFPFWYFAHCADDLPKNTCQFFLGGPVMNQKLM